MGEVLPIFRQRLREPDEIDRYKGEILGFYYDLPKEKEPAEFPRFLRSVQASEDGENQWGVEVVFGYCNHGLGHHCGFQPGVLSGEGIQVDEVRRLLIEQGFTEAEVTRGRVHAYTWYNGCDEPVTFK